MLRERPKWLEWCERVPPMESQNLHLQVRKIRNPYPQMIGHLLKKYPDLRFQDCYVDGNDWSQGNDAYRDDHPVMQFVATQLNYMNTGMSKKEAFKITEDEFRKRREHLEREQKILMARAVDAGIAPMFSTGRAYLDVQRAKAEEKHMDIIRRRLRMMTEAERGNEPPPASFRQRRSREKERLLQQSLDRMDRVGDVLRGKAGAEDPALVYEDEGITPVQVQADGEDARAEPRADSADSGDGAISRLTDNVDDESPSYSPDAVEAEQSPEHYTATEGEVIKDTPRLAPYSSPDMPMPEQTLARKRREGGRDSLGTKELSAMISRRGRKSGEDGFVLGEDQEDDYAQDEDLRRRRESRNWNPEDDEDFSGRRR